jgi:hypothetical protein
VRGWVRVIVRGLVINGVISPDEGLVNWASCIEFKLLNLGLKLNSTLRFPSPKKGVI